MQHKKPKKSPHPRELIEAEQNKIPHLKLARETQKNVYNIALDIVLGRAPKTLPSHADQLAVANNLLKILFPEKPALVTDQQVECAIDWALRPDMSPEPALYLMREILMGLSRRNDNSLNRFSAKLQVKPAYGVFVERYKSVINGL